MSLDDDGSSYINAIHDMVFFSLLQRCLKVEMLDVAGSVYSVAIY